jgi:hypothetical protein
MAAILQQLLPGILSVFFAALAAWYFLRTRIPKLTIGIRCQHVPLGDSYGLHIVVTVTNIDQREVHGDICEASVRSCIAAEVMCDYGCDVVAVMPGVDASARKDADAPYSRSRSNVWKIPPPEDDRRQIWVLDKGESNTFAFVANVPTVPRHPHGCFVQADYVSRAQPRRALLRALPPYQWRAELLYSFEQFQTNLPTMSRAPSKPNATPTI